MRGKCSISSMKRAQQAPVEPLTVSTCGVPQRTETRASNETLTISPDHVRSLNLKEAFQRSTFMFSSLLYGIGVSLLPVGKRSESGPKVYFTHNSEVLLAGSGDSTQQRMALWVTGRAKGGDSREAFMPTWVGKRCDWVNVSEWSGFGVPMLQRRPQETKSTSEGFHSCCWKMQFAPWKALC